MKDMFCVECGKETEIYKDGVCIECYLKTHQFTEGPKIIDITVCPHCGSYKYKNTWTNVILNDVLRRIIKNNFKISKELKNIDINPVCKELDKGYDCTVYISGEIGNKEVTEEHKLIIRLKKTACDVCSKQFGGYHEAIIQVRAEEKRTLSKNELTEIQNFVLNLVESMHAGGKRSLFIADMGITHGGLDFFISDKKDAYTITKKIKEEYGGTIKKSSSNVGMKDSKQVYRNTYLIRLPSYKIGDYIKLDDTYFKILSIKSNKAKLFNLKTWKIENISEDKLEDIKIINEKITKKEMIVVSQTKNEIQLMDTESYKTIQIKKPEEIKIDDEKIKILLIDGKIFLKNSINEK